VTTTDRAGRGVTEHDDSPVSAPAAGLPSVFAASAARSPDAVAVSFAGRQLTYAALHRRSAGLAAVLRRLGVGPDTRVGVCLERSPELVISLLAVTMAGGAYVPLDPAYPADRLAFMVADSRTSVLLTDRSTASALPATDAPVTYVDEPYRTGIDDAEAAPPPELSPDHLAYVIYTSGSTGVPKGTLVTHRGIGPLLKAQIDLLGAGPDDRILQFASMSFDASVFETVMALGTGATLCMATREQLAPGRALVVLLDEEGVSIVTLPPSALAVTEPRPLPALRTVTVAGEACPPDVVDRGGPQRGFLNLY
jgi:non-ribosomal peptide synthetase component F